MRNADIEYCEGLPSLRSQEAEGPLAGEPSRRRHHRLRAHLGYRMGLAVLAEVSCPVTLSEDEVVDSVPNLTHTTTLRWR
jgi:hypothetical protein